MIFDKITIDILLILIVIYIALNSNILDKNNIKIEKLESQIQIIQNGIEQNEK